MVKVGIGTLLALAFKHSYQREDTGDVGLVVPADNVRWTLVAQYQPPIVPPSHQSIFLDFKVVDVFHLFPNPPISPSLSSSARRFPHKPNSPRQPPRCTTFRTTPLLRFTHSLSHNAKSRKGSQSRRRNPCRKPHFR